MPRRALAVPLTAVLVSLATLATAACGSNGATSDRRETVHVFAASSLTEAFTEMAGVAGVDVEFQFGASSTLAQQIAQGAPADVFASADAQSMAIAAPRSSTMTIARNRLALVVEKGNPLGIDSLDDLARAGVLFVLCAPAVPCGRLGAALLAKAGVQARPASLEENVKAVVSKVTLGEADAGVVYETDVAAAEDSGAAQGVSVTEADDPALEAVYPMAVLDPSQSADAWADFVRSAAGRRILAAHGFRPPAPPAPLAP